jgi:hypothetical protein
MSHENRPVTVYISAASDLMAEREALARMIAALPVTLAWNVVQTPISQEEAFNREVLPSADLHILVMGSDIRAPVGLEWHIIRRAGRPSVPFLKRGVLRTPAGQIFIQDAGVTWRTFRDAADLRRRVRHTLAEHLIGHAARYALAATELQGLQALLASDAPAEAPGRGQEAGHSAVILSRERYEPRDGVVVGESEE